MDDGGSVVQTFNNMISLRNMGSSKRFEFSTMSSTRGGRLELRMSHFRPELKARFYTNVVVSLRIRLLRNAVRCNSMKGFEPGCRCKADYSILGSDYRDGFGDWFPFTGLVCLIIMCIDEYMYGNGAASENLSFRRKRT